MLYLIFSIQFKKYYKMSVVKRMYNIWWWQSIFFLSCAVLTVWRMKWNWLGCSYRGLTQTERAMEFVALFELNWKEGCRWTIKRDRRRRTIFFYSVLFYYRADLYNNTSRAFGAMSSLKNSAKAVWIPNAYILVVKTVIIFVWHLPSIRKMRSFSENEREK